MFHRNQEYQQAGREDDESGQARACGQSLVAGPRVGGRIDGSRRRGGFHRPRFVGVVQTLVRLKAAAQAISHQGGDYRQHDDARAGRAGKLEVQAVGPQQQHGAVHRVHRVVPHQRRQDPPPQHDDAQSHAADADFHAADIKRFVRIPGVAKSPDEPGQHQRQRHPAHQALQEGDRKHAEHELFKDRRKITAGQHEDPGEAAC